MASEQQQETRRLEFRLWALRSLAAGVALVMQQAIASLLYAAWWDIIVSGDIKLFHWEFWFFWNDYWIFMEFLSWPGKSGTEVAALSNVAGLVPVGAVYAIWRYRRR